MSVLTTESHLTVSSREAEKISDLAQYLTASPATEPETFCREAERAAAQLPSRVAEALRDFVRWGSPTGMLLFSGLPTGEVPRTPPDNSRHLGEGTVLARIQAVFNEFLGYMVAYEAEGAGHLFQDMVPSAAAARRQTSLSSAVELEVHTEQAFSTLRPDYLSLACLRGDPRARTYILPARDIVAHCTDDKLAALRKPLWTTTVDESFRVDGHDFLEGDSRGPVPILLGSTDDPFILLDQDLMRGISKTARQLLGHVIDLYLDKRRSHALAAGELIILDNDRAAHGRSEFAAKFDGTDRFIIRGFVVRDLAKSRYARLSDSRVIAARFS